MELSLEQQEAFRVLREKKALEEYRARAKMALQVYEVDESCKGQRLRVCVCRREYITVALNWHANPS